MTSRERLLKAFHLEEPDRVPCSPWGFPKYFDKLGPDYSQKIIKNTDILVAIRIGSEAETWIGGNLQDFYRKETTRDGKVTEIIETPDGPLTRIIKPTGDHVDWCLEHLFKNPTDVEKFLSIPYKQLCISMSEFYTWEQFIGNEGFVLGEISNPFCCSAYYFGTQENLLQCYYNKDLITYLLDVVVERLCDVIRNGSSLGVKAWRIVGSEFASTRVLPPECFRDYIVKYDKKIVDTIHECGGIAFMHMHDKVSDLLDDILEIGPDVIDPLEAPPGGDVELAAVKKKIGNKICLVGNIDEMTILSTASPEKVERLSIECIKAAGHGGGYVLGGTASGLFIPQTIENFLIMADVCKRYGQYPLSL